MQRIWLLNWNNISTDADFSASTLAILNQWVVSWFWYIENGATSTIQVWKALIKATRSNWDEIMCFFNLTQDITVDFTWTKKVYIEIEQANIDDGSTNNEDWTWIATIKTGATTPAQNALELLSISSGVVTDTREFVKSNLLRKNQTPYRLFVTDTDWNEIELAFGASWTVLGSTGATWSLQWITPAVDIAWLTEIQDPSADDFLIVSDTSDSWNNKKVLAGDFVNNRTFTAWENITAGQAVRFWVTLEEALDRDWTTGGGRECRAWLWENFTAPALSGYKLKTAQIRLSKINNPSGPVSGRLYSQNAGSLLQSATNTIESSTLTTAWNWQLYTYNFDTGTWPELTASWTYLIAVWFWNWNPTDRTIWQSKSVTWNTNYRNDGGGWTPVAYEERAYILTFEKPEDWTKIYLASDSASLNEMLWLSADTITSWSDWRVFVYWVSSAHSGLTVWATYYLSATSGDISTTPSWNPIWRAISSTEILINPGAF